ncbi:MAG: AmmeMemoRadiSam system radical SAM enzyme [Candidatus Brocadiales bacterium]|nr:AmmeMemoRadiSam system radical SAM enzyme [Candidatus Brocadiales bacterium]
MNKHTTRRTFLKAGVTTFGAVCLGCPDVLAASESAEDAIVSQQYDKDFPLHEAMYYKKLEDLRVECQLCPKQCRIADLERGYCGVRENRSGKYYTLVHSRVCALHIDPIEKKPFFHYLPGTPSLSLATAGCNVECKFCQNWQISQFRPEQIESIKLSPKEVIKHAKENSCPSVAYTYTEPVIFYEFMYDIARVGKEEGVTSVMVSNGYIKEEPLVELCRYLDAVKIDLKAFTEKFYKEACSSELKPILETLLTLKKLGIWFELVVLIVPTLNDSEGEIKEMCAWVFKELGPDVPIHFSRFHPTYKIKNLPPTSVRTLEKARQIALDAGLHFAYVGNVPGHEGENTYCPGCKELVIKRVGFTILQNTVRGGKCHHCQHPIAGVWDIKV